MGETRQGNERHEDRRTTGSKVVDLGLWPLARDFNGDKVRLRLPRARDLGCQRSLLLRSPGPPGTRAAAVSRGPGRMPVASGAGRAHASGKAGPAARPAEQKANFGKAPGARGRPEASGGRGALRVWVQGRAGGWGPADSGGRATDAPPPDRTPPRGGLLGKPAHRTHVAPPTAPWRPRPAGAKKRARAACSPAGQRRPRAAGLRTPRAPAALL